MLVKFKLRRATQAEWLALNPILAAGEPAYTTDIDQLKIGDGVKSWDQLSYFLDSVSVTALVQNLIENAVLEGVPGADGASAYEVAVANGFVGTVSQWLVSLIGPKGDPGADGVSYTGPKITVSATAPASPSVGDVWIDTSS